MGYRNPQELDPITTGSKNKGFYIGL